MFRKFTALAVAATVLLSPVQNATASEIKPNSSSATTLDNKNIQQSVSSAVYYDFRNDQFGTSETSALRLGFSPEEISTFRNNLGKLAPSESRALPEASGLDVESLRSENAVPAIVWAIAGFLGGAAADELISQVWNWGISGACRNLEGNWNVFDDFCRSNGHI